MNFLTHYFLAPAAAAAFLRGRFAVVLADSTAARREDLLESAIEAPLRRFA
jgi:hypothetical protein